MARNGFAIGLLCGALGLALAATAQATPIDLLLSTNGGVADINGASGPGSGGFGTVAANLNDGNSDGAYGDGSLAHSTGNGAGNYMDVTIPAPTAIGSIVLYNRTDCCDTRIDGSGTTPYTLTVYNGVNSVFSENLTFTADTTGTNISGQTIPLPAGVVGNIVRVTQNFGDYQNLAELQAFAPVPEPASLVLFGLGAVGLLAAARRRRSA